MYAEVHHVETLSPSLLRVHLTGGTLNEFEASGATDAYINARFLPADSTLTVPFSSDDIDRAAPEHRPRPRRFTIRRWDAATQTLSIDFVVHGDVGYAGAWAQRAKPGDRLQFSGPGGSYRPSPNVDWHLLAGDESALGAIGASIEALAPGERALAFVVVDNAAGEIELPSAGDVDVRWLHRAGAEDPEALLAEAVSEASFPAGSFDVFVHGEAAEVRAVRRHLVADRGVDPSTASISPYWRRTFTDEDWRRVKRQWMAEQLLDA
jgi:NADPH-dependent ferric siderophore reductase